MVEQSFPTVRDSMGEVKVPKGAYYGAQTQRAVENFPVSGIGRVESFEFNTMMPIMSLRLLEAIQFTANVVS